MQPKQIQIRIKLQIQIPFHSELQRLNEFWNLNLLRRAAASLFVGHFATWLEGAVAIEVASTWLRLAFGSCK